MSSLKEVKNRRSSVKSTRQITSAMKMVAAAKLRKAQDKIVRLRPYAGKLNEILTNLTQSLADSEEDNIYGRKSEPERILIVVITSNKGLCGSFNSNVIREVRRIIYEDYYKQYELGNLWFIAIGKKGYDLNGIQGVGKYIKDYSTLLTGGLTGNLAVTYLGSYKLTWSVIKKEENSATVLFEVSNSSTLQSATRPPILGYIPLWQNTVGKGLNDAFSSGPLSKTTQRFVWTEKIDLK